MNEEMEDKKWQLTFSDMLTLLLTFFVFIIAVSSFKTKEYKKFWELFPSTIQKRQPTKSFKIRLIKGLKVPQLSAEAEILLNKLEETFTNSDFEGMDVYFNENKISLMISEKLSFEGGKYDLKEESKPLLSKLVPTMQASLFGVSVEGHSDSLKHEKIDNIELSLNRALTVARFLIKNGLDKDRVSVSGYGPYRPIADNKTLEGRMRNRRVEINIMINND